MFKLFRFVWWMCVPSILLFCFERVILNSGFISSYDRYKEILFFILIMLQKQQSWSCSASLMVVSQLFRNPRGSKFSVAWMFSNNREQIKSWTSENSTYKPVIIVVLQVSLTTSSTLCTMSSVATDLYPCPSSSCSSFWQTF